MYAIIIIPKIFGLLRCLYTIRATTKEHECPKFLKLLFFFAVWWLVYTARNVRPNSALHPVDNTAESCGWFTRFSVPAQDFFGFLFLLFTPQRWQQQIHLSWPPKNRDKAVGRLLPKHLSCLRAVYKMNLSDPINNFFRCILIRTLLQYRFTTHSMIETERK